MMKKILFLLSLFILISIPVLGADRLRTILWVDKTSSEHDIFALTNRLTELTGETIWTGDVGCAWARISETNIQGYTLSFYADAIICPVEVTPGITNMMPLTAFVGSNWTTAELESPTNVYWMEGTKNPLQILYDNGFINMNNYTE